MFLFYKRNIPTLTYSQKGGSKIHNSLRTLTISSTRGSRVMSSSFFKIWNLLTLPMACSTYIPTLAIFDVFMTSEANICIAAVELGGMHNVAIDIIRSSFILNTLSAITSSYGSMMFRKPQSLTMKASDALPSQPWKR